MPAHAQGCAGGTQVGRRPGVAALVFPQQFCRLRHELPQCVGSEDLAGLTHIHPPAAIVHICVHSLSLTRPSAGMGHSQPTNSSRFKITFSLQVRPQVTSTDAPLQCTAQMALPHSTKTSGHTGALTHNLANPGSGKRSQSENFSSSFSSSSFFFFSKQLAVGLSVTMTKVLHQGHLQELHDRLLSCKVLITDQQPSMPYF